MHFKVKSTFWGYLLLWAINNTIPPAQTIEILQLTQQWSNSHFQVILFTKYNKGKIYSKQTRTIIPIYIVGISQSFIKAGNFLSFRSSFHNPKIKSLDNKVHHLHSNTFPKKNKKGKKKTTNKGTELLWLTSGTSFDDHRIFFF